VYDAGVAAHDQHEACVYIQIITHKSYKSCGMLATAFSKSSRLYASISSCANTSRTQRNIPRDCQFLVKYMAIIVLRTYHLALHVECVI
jgi:hypothetical protein